MPTLSTAHPRQTFQWTAKTTRLHHCLRRDTGQLTDTSSRTTSSPGRFSLALGAERDHQTPSICGCNKLAFKLAYDYTINMAGTPEFLSVLRRVGFSLSNGNFPSLNFKPLQVKCFESILQGQDVIGVLPTGFGKSMLFHLLPHFIPVKKTKNIGMFTGFWVTEFDFFQSDSNINSDPISFNRAR